MTSDLEEIPTGRDDTPPTPSLVSSEAVAQVERHRAGMLALTRLDDYATQLDRLRDFLDQRLGNHAPSGARSTVDRALQLIVGYETSLRARNDRPVTSRLPGVFTFADGTRRCGECSRDLWPSEEICSACNPPRWSAPHPGRDAFEIYPSLTHEVHITPTEGAVQNTRRGPFPAEW